MNFINPPIKSPDNVIHKTFFSQLFSHEVGYNIYLPPDYEKNGENYPVTYHFHRWEGDESSDICIIIFIMSSESAIKTITSWWNYLEGIFK
jgi:hypothetical protein